MQTLQSRQKKTDLKPTASRYLRLHPLETEVYKTHDPRGSNWSGFWASVPSSAWGMTKIVCSGEDEIVRLISRGVLVPVISTNKEYAIQKALGTADHRAYRLSTMIAAKYKFCYDTLMTLSMIENLIDLCDYNIFDRVPGGLSSDGQPYLEILPKEGTVVRNYKGQIVTESLGDIHFVACHSFEDMIQRGIIVLQGTKWKLSRNYWEFTL